MLSSSIDRSNPMRVSTITVAVVLAAAVPVAQQQGPISRLISARELAQLRDPALVLLHVAEDDSAYAEGHIPGARFLRYRSAAPGGDDDLGAELPPMPVLKELFDGVGVSDTSRVVLYGHPVLASRVFFTLDAVGHRRVAILDGGLQAWQAGGHPVDRGADKTAGGRRGTFTPRLHAERLATAEWIRTSAGRISLVDVRPDPEFTGSDGGMAGVHVAGHIEGAKQLTWNALVAPDGLFLPADQLRAKLQGAGAVAGKAVVPYCMIGMRASVVYFVARHLGLDVRLYDGSIVDWGRRGLPTKMGR
jgi:thiosulfate/3-mercaptopyruvate sulfurtransferase